MRMVSAFYWDPHRICQAKKGCSRSRLRGRHTVRSRSLAYRACCRQDCGHGNSVTYRAQARRSGEPVDVGGVQEAVRCFEKEFDRTVVYLRETIEEYRTTTVKAATSCPSMEHSRRFGVGPLSFSLRTIQLPIERDVLCLVANTFDGEHMRFQTGEIRRFAHHALVGSVC